MSMKAHARVFGDQIDTDVIIPAPYLTSRDPVFLGSKCMEPIDPDFSKRIDRGDVLVAGRNFGCGSSREHAVMALQGAGISCVVAKSYARIFYRNAINQGLSIVTCPEAVDAAKEGDEIEVDLTAGAVKVAGRSFPIEPFPPFLADFIRGGGLVPYVRRQLAARAAAKAAEGASA
jgi:3-isopropylmalate/(R)-2-methylmalate dehydratase small subunit